MRAASIVGLLSLSLLWAVGMLRADLLPGLIANPLPHLQKQAISFGLLIVLTSLVAVMRRERWPSSRLLWDSVFVGLGLFVVPLALTILADGWVPGLVQTALFTLTPVFALVFEPLHKHWNRDAEPRRPDCSACILRRSALRFSVEYSNLDRGSRRIVCSNPGNCLRGRGQLQSCSNGERAFRVFHDHACGNRRSNCDDRARNSKRRDGAAGLEMVCTGSRVNVVRLDRSTRIVIAILAAAAHLCSAHDNALRACPAARDFGRCRIDESSLGAANLAGIVTNGSRCGISADSS
jgi:hypothetical protein